MLCRLCGAEAYDFSVGHAMYAECPRCSYVELDAAAIPPPVAEEARYRLHRNSYDDMAYRAWIENYLDVAVPFMKPGGLVLDFGSGPEPVPARLLSERGFSVSIYDPYFAPGEPWRRGVWDAILVHEVAEHIAWPALAFAELADALAPGGALCVRTRFPPAERAVFERWRYRMDETHVGFFAADSVRWMAERLGLRVALLEAPDRIVLLKPAVTP